MIANIHDVTRSNSKLEPLAGASYNLAAASEKQGEMMAKKTATIKPPKPKPKYKRNFLTEVIARLDFSLVQAIAEKGPPKAVVAALKKEFPIPEMKKVRHVMLSTEAKDRSIEEKFEWFYHSDGREKNIHITESCVYVQYKKYKSFERLKADFLPVVDALFAFEPNLQATRLGLRYVDTLDFKEPDPTAWEQYLDPKLLCGFKIASNRSTISRALSVIEFNYGETQMRFAYGMPNSDHPAPIRKKLFTLDFDAFCQSLLSQDEVSQYLNQFHDKLKASFEEIITDKLREKMGVTYGK